MTQRIQGVIAPVTTPFVRDEVCVVHLQENLRKYGNTGLSGIFVLGSNGENRSLSTQEKLTTLKTAVEAKAEHQLLIAGTGCESTHETIALSQQAAQMGANYVILLSPSYFKKHLGEAALVRYYVDVADAVPVPVLLYNAPGFSGVAIPRGVVEAVCRHPNIAGIKDSSLDGYVQYLPCCTDDFVYLAGSINSLFAVMSLGASGGILSLADAFPQPCCELYQRLARLDTLSREERQEARQRYFRLSRLSQCISGTFGVAGVKYAMDLAGYHGGEPRRPLLPLKDGDRGAIRAAVERMGLLSGGGEDPPSVSANLRLDPLPGK